jgi:ubiquinone/menaquinone biosynthesis C-methylase UbiE
MTVCDLGSGNGYHSLQMAKFVEPGGKIIAVDIQKEMLDQLDERAAAAGVKNVETRLGELHDPKLADNSCDLILLVDVYHEFSHPAHMLAAMRKALKPEGVVALVEFRGEDPEVPIKPEHKMTKAQIRKEWEAAGFVVAREFDALPWQHLMFWKRK